MTEKEREMKNPAGENAKFEFNPWMFAKGKEQTRTLEVASDENSRRAKKSSPLSTELEMGAVIVAHDNKTNSKDMEH